MKIAILGTGNMGQGLARLVVEADYDVIIGARDAAKAIAIAKELGPRAQGKGIAAAVALGDLVILAVPYAGVEDVLAAAGDFKGKIVVDITNPITPDYMALTIGHTSSAAEEIAKRVPSARVVKAFNTIFAQLLPSAARAGHPKVQVFTAADDEPARQAVAAFIERAGFEHVAAGPLANARYIEPVAELNIHFGYVLGWGTAIAPAWVKFAR